MDIAAYTGLVSDTCLASGPYRNSYEGSLVPRYLNNRAQTIFGGSDEILLNILARTALGFS